MWPFRKAPAGPLGPRGEDLAARHLKRAGYRIVERNVRAGRHEIDIVARQGDTVVFVEVRTRASAAPVPPEDTINPEKRRRLVSAARHYMTRHPEPETYYRFDIIAILMPERGKPQVTWLQDAFQEKRT
jgi:putative endonuclease